MSIPSQVLHLLFFITAYFAIVNSRRVYSNERIYSQSETENLFEKN